MIGQPGTNGADQLHDWCGVCDEQHPGRDTWRPQGYCLPRTTTNARSIAGNMFLRDQRNKRRWRHPSIHTLTQNMSALFTRVCSRWWRQMWEWNIREWPCIAFKCLELVLNSRPVCLLCGAMYVARVLTLAPYICCLRWLGTHHTKAMLLFYRDNTMQFVVHTANMIERDWRYGNISF